MRRSDLLERPRHAGHRELEAVAGDEEARRPGQRRRVFAEQHLADPRQRLGVAREEADRVEARRQRHRALERDAAMGRAQAENAAIAGRGAHSAANIAGKRDIGEPPGHRDGRPRCRAARDAPRGCRIHGRAEMHVPAADRIGEFVGLRFADELGTGVEQPFDRRRGGALVAGGRKLQRVAAAGGISGHVENIHDRKREPRQRTARGGAHRRFWIGHQRVKSVASHRRSKVGRPILTDDRHRR